MLGKRLAPVLAAACAGAALFAPGTAVAASPTVAFQGGCGLLGVGASSHPDAGSVAVRSGGTVTFVNHLGQPAHLIINGADRGVVPRDNQVAVPAGREVPRGQGHAQRLCGAGCAGGLRRSCGASTRRWYRAVSRRAGRSRCGGTRDRRCFGRYRGPRPTRSSPPGRAADFCRCDLRGWRVSSGNSGYHRSTGNPVGCHIRSIQAPRGVVHPARRCGRSSPGPTQADG